MPFPVLGFHGSKTFFFYSQRISRQGFRANNLNLLYGSLQKIYLPFLFDLNRDNWHSYPKPKGGNMEYDILIRKFNELKAATQRWYKIEEEKRKAPPLPKGAIKKIYDGLKKANLT
jgi:hypothetical protein